MARQRAGYAAGFTLIEIMVVILILGLLATLVVPRLTGAIDTAKQTKARSDIQEIEQQLERYYMDNGSYPTSDQGLQALVTPPTTGNTPTNYVEGGYIKQIPLDPWGHPYFYQSDGNSFILKSFGADGAEGGTGKNADIVETGGQ